jgi:hypothetical protein
VYLPNDATYKNCREGIYMHLSSLVANHNPDHTVVLTGDWNACLLPSDRTGMLTATDRNHAACMAAAAPRASKCLLSLSTATDATHLADRTDRIACSMTP